MSPTKLLTPELLLKDDSLVKVDTSSNYLRVLNGTCINISGSDRIAVASRRSLRETTREILGKLRITVIPSWPIYISIQLSGIAGISSLPTNEEFPIQDSASLQPLDILHNANRLFWIIVKVPDDATAGDYNGTITLKSAAG
jgi:hypothetical protein